MTGDDGARSLSIRVGTMRSRIGTIRVVYFIRLLSLMLVLFRHITDGMMLDGSDELHFLVLRGLSLHIAPG